MTTHEKLLIQVHDDLTEVKRHLRRSTELLNRSSEVVIHAQELIIEAEQIITSIALARGRPVSGMGSSLRYAEPSESCV